MSTAATVKERPILFSAPMVRAILAGTKTQTRRIVKPEPPEEWEPLYVERYQPSIETDYGLFDDGSEVFGAYDEEWGVKCPYGGPGERLWVKETWTPDHASFYPNHPVVYRADLGFDYQRNDEGKVYSPEQKAWYPYRWRPSIHMPRRVSRITLEITEVRVERLQDTSEADAISEGAQCAGFPASLTNRGAFAKLWEKINGPASWDANPWVWVIEFRRVEN